MKRSAFARRNVGPSEAYGSATCRSTSVSEQKFDPQSGQVYSETEVRPDRNKTLDWIGALKTPNLIKKPQPNEHGARSLADMASIEVVSQFENLSPEHFATVPWPMAQKVWEQLQSMYDVSNSSNMSTC